MSQKTPTIVAQKRERTGTRYSERLRKTGDLPAILYGHGQTPVSFALNGKDILTHLHRGVHVFNIEIDGAAAEMCLIKDLQFGYLGDDVIHLDFTRIDLTEKVTVNVHITWIGTPVEAEKAGSILQHEMAEMAVACAANEIPGEIRVDLSKMEGTQLLAGDIELPEGVELAVDAGTMVASVGFVAAPEEDDADTAAPETGDDAATPEVIGGDAAE